MSVAKHQPLKEVDLTVADDGDEIQDAHRYDLMRINAVVQSGTWGAAVITVEGTVGDDDNTGWVALDVPLAIASGAGYGSGPDGPSAYRAINCFSRVRYRVSTTQVGACLVKIYVALSPDSPGRNVVTLPADPQ